MITCSWIRTDVDFGAPYCTFVLHVRSRLGQEFMKEWKMNIEDSSGACLQAIVVEKFIERVRPELKGFMVIGMMMNEFRALKFQVLHPSLERVKEGGYREERLELCPVCNSPLSMDKQWLRIMNMVEGSKDGTGHCEEVCSEECVTASIVDRVHIVNPF